VRAALEICACLLFFALPRGPQLRARRSHPAREPYSLDGSFAARPFAVYLLKRCAASPLRSAAAILVNSRCFSRYHISRYDWVASPSSPIFTLSKSGKISICGSKLVWFLRNQYRASILQPWFPIAFLDPIPETGISSPAPPTTAPLRFQLPTSPDDDDRFIAKFNSGQNRQPTNCHR